MEIICGQCGRRLKSVSGQSRHQTHCKKPRSRRVRFHPTVLYYRPRSSTTSSTSGKEEDGYGTGKHSGVLLRQLDAEEAVRDPRQDRALAVAVIQHDGAFDEEEAVRNPQQDRAMATAVIQHNEVFNEEKAMPSSVCNDQIQPIEEMAMPQHFLEERHLDMVKTTTTASTKGPASNHTVTETKTYFEAAGRHAGEVVSSVVGVDTYGIANYGMC